MNNIALNWKKIGRGLPRAGKAANDRAPTLTEIRKLVRVSRQKNQAHSEVDGSLCSSYRGVGLP
jgi:hypothetical protein